MNSTEKANFGVWQKNRGELDMDFIIYHEEDGHLVAEIKCKRLEPIEVVAYQTNGTTQIFKFVTGHAVLTYINGQMPDTICEFSAASAAVLKQISYYPNVSEKDLNGTPI